MSLAGNLLRTCKTRLFAVTAPSALGTSNTIGNQQKRSIVTKEMLCLPENHPSPWPYKEKGYNWFHAMYDRTKKRFHQNSRLIVVEGNIGCEKSATAKDLAEHLGFYYMPEFKVEDLLIDRYGQDMRSFYHLFPKRFRIPDEEMFYKNPGSDMSAVMRDYILKCRFDQYLNAVAHILNTGQGVVLEQSFHTDFVFANAMRAKNYIGPEYFKYYFYVRKNAIPYVYFWPHLVLYLDAPVSVCLENIRKEGNVNKAAVIDETYLQTIAESFKDALREFKRHSKILAYDWSKPGDIDTIVEDIERIDFDFFEWHSGDVFETWHLPQDEMEWTERRIMITHKYELLIKAFEGIPSHEVAEIYVNPRDLGHYINTMKTQVLKSPYSYGFIRERGDKIAATWRTKFGLTRPKPWFDYYLRESWYDNISAHESGIDPWAENYDPDYVHHH